MNFLKKIFSGKSKVSNLGIDDLLKENDIKVEVSLDGNNDPDSINDEDYKYHHLFIYYLIEESKRDLQNQKLVK